MKTLAYGFPKLGEKREFKSLLENFWKGKISEADFIDGMNSLRDWMAELYSSHVDLFPSGELSYYDFVLDTAITLGAVPKRFGDYRGLETYFQMARGGQALEMTKYFNTNYHYLVPELESKSFRLLKNIPLEEFSHFKNRGYSPLPKLVAPFTFLKLSKVLKKSSTSQLPLYELSKLESQKDFEEYLNAVFPVYEELLKSLKGAGAQAVLMEDPALCLEMEGWEWELVHETYGCLSKHLDVYVLTYYDSLSDYRRFVDLPVKALGLEIFPEVPAESLTVIKAPSELNTAEFIKFLTSNEPLEIVNVTAPVLDKIKLFPNLNSVPLNDSVAVVVFLNSKS
ncbi:MAG: hypothetical protein ACK42C_03285 [Aquificaceae bacterium]